MMQRFLIVVWCAVASCLPQAALAEREDGLYGAVVPKGAAFVRVLGASSESLTILGRKVPTTELPEDVYVAFAPGVLPEAKDGAHYTVFEAAGQVLSVVEEPARDKPGKVYLSMVNLGSELPAALSVADGGPEVLGDVAVGAAATRAVNPLSVTLGVSYGSDATTFYVVLRRGQNLSFVVLPDGSVEMIKDTYGPVFAEAGQ
ncbi:alginate O-acetyltransferase AlgF [Shimia ponticola]|uniref:alginate O-acetyltransferase AlgF n=1 Tax=Shimia ponticola TaxID=2582893 RepID=UPI0011BFC20C|nr:alginate O-acetyltransferase AlgF [Shimia ponticola]